MVETIFKNILFEKKIKITKIFNPFYILVILKLPKNNLLLIVLKMPV